jgi:hypothetical protein
MRPPRTTPTARAVIRQDHGQRRGRELPAGLDAVEADDLPELRSLAAGMRRDLPAVINGLTLEHNSGAVEMATSPASSDSSATATGE